MIPKLTMSPRPQGSLRDGWAIGVRWATLALAVTAASAQSAFKNFELYKCDHIAQRGMHCSQSVLVSSVPTLVCSYNAPLSPASLLTKGALRLFDAEVAKIRADHNAIDYITTSEDTYLAPLIRGQSAEEQAKVTFASESHLSSLTQLKRAITGAFTSDNKLRVVAFSPFYPSCVGLMGLPGRKAANVTVEWHREGPEMDDKRSALRLWAGPALLVSGLLLFAYAPTFAESVVFHYAGGVTLAMVIRHADLHRPPPCRAACNPPISPLHLLSPSRVVALASWPSACSSYSTSCGLALDAAHAWASPSWACSRRLAWACASTPTMPSSSSQPPTGRTRSHTLPYLGSSGMGSPSTVSRVAGQRHTSARCSRARCASSH